VKKAFGTVSCEEFYFASYQRFLTLFSSKKSKKPAQKEAGFLDVTWWGRRYAELSYLLPFLLGPAVKNPVYRLFLFARHLPIS
jgi:hypothetical protein